MRNKGEAAAGAERDASKKTIRMAEITGRIAEIDANLSARASKFSDQVRSVLGNHLLVDGEQVLRASSRQALLVQLPTAERPDPSKLERILDDLRRENPGMIDLRPLKRERGFGLTASVIKDAGVDDATLARDLQAEVEHAAIKRAPGLFATEALMLDRRSQPAITLDLMTAEESLDTYISPVTRVVDLGLALFDCVPRPERRLSAVARNLRSPTETNHVRADPGPGPKTISITAVFSETATKAAAADDPVGHRLRDLLGRSGTANGGLARARALYDRIEEAAATQRFTIARPVLASGYAPMKYDYMSGYIWMFFMSLIGITITVIFTRFETRGLIRKRGIEEAQES